MAEAGTLSILEYGAESAIIPGQLESGDRYIVKETSMGALIGVLDGLGHGTEAATASGLAIKVIENHADEPVVTIARRCHEKLNRTRGVVMALVSINSADGTLTWLSIGNVEGTLIRANARAVPGYESIFMHPGVVGFRLPPISASALLISRNDVLILSTDGIRNDKNEAIVSNIRSALNPSGPSTNAQSRSVTAEDLTKSETANQDAGAENPGPQPQEAFSPQKMAKYICTHFSKGSDDALVVVARYNGDHDDRNPVSRRKA
ncbi:MAG: SpoIIE family protein phosphatase [Candidatus Kryptoniota bacterium]